MNVVISGASKGIGRAIAEHFAAEGANLFLCSRNMDKSVDWQQQLMKKHGINITTFNADLSNAAEVQSFAAQLLKATDQIDVLVNNAGNYIPGSVYNEPVGQLEEMMNLNLYSAYHLTRALIATMINKGSGHIFNICSIAALKAFNIKVTAVHPGATLSSSWDGFDIDPKRIMEVDDIAKMIIAASKLSAQACVEEIVIRPQLGDL